MLSTAHSTLASLIRRKRSFAWKAEFTKRLERANQRATERICAEFPDLRSELKQASDLMLILSDLERELFPEWWGIWTEELKREELVKTE